MFYEYFVMTYMNQIKRTELLKDLEKTMQEILKASDGNPKQYDKMTQEVSKIIGEIKNWNMLQIKLFEIYFELLKSNL